MNDKGSTLFAHCGAKFVTRDELKEIPVPEGTRTHQPLSHYEIVEVLEESLSFRRLRVVKDEYAISADGMKMFGVMDLDAEFGDCRFSIGLRNSNDKSMRLALTAGYRVFVCDNMAFSGDFTPLLHKHTRNFELRDSISIAVDRIHRGFDGLEGCVKDMQNFILSDNDARLLIYRAFVEGRIKAMPKNLLPAVHDLYFEPDRDEFRPRSLWSLSNAFTSAFKQLLPIKRFEVTARLGSYMKDVQADSISSEPQHPGLAIGQMGDSPSNDNEDEYTPVVDCGTSRFRLVLPNGSANPIAEETPEENVDRSESEDLMDGGSDDDAYSDRLDDLVDSMIDGSAEKAAA